LRDCFNALYYLVIDFHLLVYLDAVVSAVGGLKVGVEAIKQGSFGNL
jgi:hypothetical protein